MSRETVQDPCMWNSWFLKVCTVLATNNYTQDDFYFTCEYAHVSPTHFIHAACCLIRPLPLSLLVCISHTSLLVLLNARKHSHNHYLVFEAVTGYEGLLPGDEGKTGGKMTEVWTNITSGNRLKGNLSPWVTPPSALSHTQVCQF